MSNFFHTNGVSIQKAFENFDEQNPRVWKEYVKRVMLAIAKGKKKISSKLVLNVIRWEVYMETTDGVGYINENGERQTFRINDAYTSRYARKFQEKFPKHADIFTFRELRAN
jgi:hypothetical protein